MNSNPFYMYSYSSLQTEIVFVGRKKVKLLSMRKKIQVMIHQKRNHQKLISLTNS